VKAIQGKAEEERYNRGLRAKYRPDSPAARSAERTISRALLADGRAASRMNTSNRSLNPSPPFAVRPKPLLHARILHFRRTSRRSRPAPNCPPSTRQGRSSKPSRCGLSANASPGTEGKPVDKKTVLTDRLRRRRRQEPPAAKGREALEPVTFTRLAADSLARILRGRQEKSNGEPRQPHDAPGSVAISNACGSKQERTLWPEMSAESAACKVPGLACLTSWGSAKRKPDPTGAGFHSSIREGLTYFRTISKQKFCGSRTTGHGRNQEDGCRRRRRRDRICFTPSRTSSAATAERRRIDRALVYCGVPPRVSCMPGKPRSGSTTAPARHGSIGNDLARPGGQVSLVPVEEQQ